MGLFFAAMPQKTNPFPRSRRGYAAPIAAAKDDFEVALVPLSGSRSMTLTNQDLLFRIRERLGLTLRLGKRQNDCECP
jgi:hypothetical protein